MALQESLNKQQQKCLSTITSIKARAGSSKATQHQKDASAITPSSIPARSLTTSIKFSSDIERHQHIYNIRNSPVGAQMKRVINLLLETRRALTPEEIKEACYVDVKANKAVSDSLRNNLNVSYDGKCFSYKSKHNVKDKNQLLALIQKFPEGIAVTNLKDAYPTVMGDLQALKATGEVWLLPNSNPQDNIVFPNDPRLPIMVDDDLKLFFRGIELPRDMVDIEKDLQKNGMKPVTNTAKRQAMAQMHGVTPKTKPKKRQRAFSKRTKLTNVHLPELFLT